MLIEQALMTYILAQTGITDLVSTRIYFVEGPQETAKPYLVINKIDGPREHSHDGSSSLAHPRFQLTAFAETYSGAKNIISAVQTALQGYSGTMGGESGVAVGAVLYEDETDLERGGQGLYGVSADYIIWHEE